MRLSRPLLKDLAATAVCSVALLLANTHWHPESADVPSFVVVFFALVTWSVVIRKVLGLSSPTESPVGIALFVGGVWFSAKLLQGEPGRHVLPALGVAVTFGILSTLATWVVLISAGRVLNSFKKNR
jgi:hypothetical protein